MKTSKFFEFGFATKRDLQELSEAIKNAETIDGEVSSYADLPAPANHNGEIWLVKTTTGVIFVNKKVAGLYVSNGTIWTIITPVEIDGYQKLITTPTDGNVVITDANGQTQNGNKKLDDLEQVLSYNNFASFPATGNINKIYIAKDVNTIYRWNGTQYVVISSSLVLGETSSTAYRGDLGKIAYDHSQATGNPHGTTKTHIGLGNVNNTSDVDKPISNATQNALNLKQNTIPDGAKINVVGSDVASASTVNLDNATGDIITITGTTTITAITLSAGVKKVVRFAETLTLTNSANLVLPTSDNITTTSGDYATFIGFTGGVVRCTSYSKANGTPLAINGGAGLLSSLVVNSSITTPLSNYAFYANTGTAYTGYVTGSNLVPISINAASRVKASEFNATSDIRIKNIIGLSNSTKDLETLNKIEITDYYFKDKAKGIKPVKKVIGQQLEKMFPQAVNKTTDFIPDIMKMSKKIIDNKIYLKNHNLKKGDIVRIISDKETIDVKVENTNKEYFVINKKIKDNQVFVYGKQVNDFLLVDYDALITLAISAIQEIYRKIQ